MCVWGPLWVRGPALAAAGGRGGRGLVCVGAAWLCWGGGELAVLRAAAALALQMSSYKRATLDEELLVEAADGGGDGYPNGAQVSAPGGGAGEGGGRCSSADACCCPCGRRGRRAESPRAPSPEPALQQRWGPWRCRGTIAGGALPCRVTGGGIPLCSLAFSALGGLAEKVKRKGGGASVGEGGVATALFQMPPPPAFLRSSGSSFRGAALSPAAHASHHRL